MLNHRLQSDSWIDVIDKKLDGTLYHSLASDTASIVGIDECYAARNELEAGVDISVLKEESEERNYLSHDCVVNVLLSTWVT